MSRRNLLLLAVLIALVAVDFATSRRLPSRSNSGRVFADFEPEDVTRIEVDGSDGRLVLACEGEQWRLESLDGLPVLDAAPTRALASIRRILGADRVGARDERELFGLGDDEGVAVRLEGVDGTRLAEFEQGRAPSGLAAGAARLATTVLPADDDAIYLSSTLAYFELRPSAYWDARLLDFDAATVERIDVQFGLDGAALSIVRADSGRFELADSDRALPQLEVEALLAASRGSFFNDYIGKSQEAAHGFDDPTVTVAVKLLDDSTLQRITVGAETQDGGYVATSSRWPEGYIVEISAATLAELLAPVERISEAVSKQ